jgi:hypothetical protein
MKKKSRILLVALVVVVMIGLAWVLVPSGPADQVYEGHPVSYWLRNGRSGTAISVASLPFIAGYANVRLDSNAVPFLAKALQRRDGSMQFVYANVWARMPAGLRKYLPTPVAAAKVRVNAEALLDQMEGEARDAIPALILTLRGDEDEHVRAYAAIALREIGPDDQRVRDALFEAMQDHDVEVRGMPSNCWAYTQMRRAPQAEK